MIVWQSLKSVLFEPSRKMEPDETFGKFVQRMAASSMKDAGIVPTKDDKVVTLSTCSTSGETYRFVVHGVRVDEH